MRSWHFLQPAAQPTRCLEGAQEGWRAESPKRSLAIFADDPKPLLRHRTPKLGRSVFPAVLTPIRSDALGLSRTKLAVLSADLQALVRRIFVEPIRDGDL